MIERVVTDSREAQPGALFVALVGEHRDGQHRMANAVQEAIGAILYGGD